MSCEELMTEWKNVSPPYEGIVAVAFGDANVIAVSTHDGLHYYDYGSTRHLTTSSEVAPHEVYENEWLNDPSGPCGPLRFFGGYPDNRLSYRLPLTTPDGWKVSNQSNGVVISNGTDRDELIRYYPQRGFGFSEDGRCVVMLSNGEVVLFVRAKARGSAEGLR